MIDVLEEIFPKCLALIVFDFLRVDPRPFLWSHGRDCFCPVPPARDDRAIQTYDEEDLITLPGLALFW